MGGLSLTVVNHGPALFHLDDERLGVTVARCGHGHPLIVALGCPAATSTDSSRDRHV